MTFFVAALVLFIVWLNISDSRRRHAMTPSQRQAEDDYLDYNSVW